VSTYSFDDWFEAPGHEERHPVVSAALNYADESGIEKHAFFSFAARSPEALRIWVSQELIVTGPFSQALLRLSALEKNVHLRAMMMIVINGEHGRVIKQKAPGSHPWLLNQLRLSMGMAKNEVQPVEETLEFLDLLNQEVESSIRGLAATGIGNERLILPEYSAVKSCFATCWPSTNYAKFLDANIGEDMRHSELLADVASVLIRHGADADLYYDAARRSVDSRVRYYDRLLIRVAQD